MGCALGLVVTWMAEAHGHGSAISPASRVYRVYASNPENPSFQLARNAVQTDGTLSYYTWTELSRNIPAAVNAGLPAGFDYSPWVPDGTLASGGRVIQNSTEYPRTYAGLDQVSANWPASPAQAGERLSIDFDAHTPHDPSVWDVWMTAADWTPDQPLTWDKMEFLERPSVTLSGMHYFFDVAIPSNRVGHHVLWIAWQRDDPVGEVFFSTSDIMVAPAAALPGDFTADGRVDAADYTAWRDHRGAAPGSLPNDVDGGVIGTAHYSRWKTSFGVRSAPASAVPEAAKGSMLLIAAASITWQAGRAFRRMPPCILAL